MKVKIQVTNDDILRGIPHDGWSCPVAIAMARVFGRRFRRIGLDLAEVGGRYIIVPSGVSMFMKVFDNGGRVLPIEFTLNVPGLKPEKDHP